jgi:hypothetical protein
MIPTDIILNVFNFIDIILVGIMCVLAYQLLHKFDKCGGIKPWWFAILPFVFIYSFIGRIGIFLSQSNIIPIEYLNIIIAAYTGFYIGMIAFLYGMNTICAHINEGYKE